jgi:hypothetical protein
MPQETRRKDTGGNPANAARRRTDFAEGALPGRSPIRLGVRVVAGPETSSASEPNVCDRRLLFQGPAMSDLLRLNVLREDEDRAAIADSGVPAARSLLEIRSMAAVVQTNLGRLQVEIEQRSRSILFSDDERIIPPKPPSRFREHIIAEAALSQYSDTALLLRMHEVWGQFCTFLWYFHRSGFQQPRDVQSLPSWPETRCAASMGAKHDEIHAVLWKLRFEQRRRGDAEYRASGTFDRDCDFSEQIPVPLFDKAIQDCTDEELLIGACEYAGMLAAIRWMTDSGRSWGEPGLMSVADEPFP